MNTNDGPGPGKSDIDDRIEQSLDRLFHPPEMPAALRDQLQSRVVSVVEDSPRPIRKRSPGYSAAVVVLAIGLSGIAVRLWIDALSGPAKDSSSEYAAAYHQPGEVKPLVAVYAETVDAGFRPGWLCEDDREFAQTFDRRHGQPLLLRDLPEGSRMLGLAYYGGLTPRTTSLLCEVDSQPVMVFIDNSSADAETPLTEPTDQLNIFSRSMGDLMLFEVTPLDESRVLAWLSVPSSTPDTTQEKSESDKSLQ